MKHDRFTLITLLAIILGWVSANIYLPSLPLLDRIFHTSPAYVKLSISLFLISFGVSQFVWGSLSERFGRKGPLMIGLGVSLIGVLISLCSFNVLMFNIGRLIEGFGVGSVAVLGRAIFTDRFNKHELSTLMSHVTTTANVMPALAPIIGGYLTQWFDWRAVFVFLLGYTILLLWQFNRHIPETHKNINHRLTFLQSLGDYHIVGKHRTFWGYLIPYMMLSGGMIAYYTATPFIFVDELHVSPDVYGYLSIVNVVTYIIAANINPWLTKHISHDFPLVLGCCITLASGLLMLACWYWLSFSILTVLIPTAVYTFGAGLVSPNANSGAMSALAHKAGAAAAVLGASVYACSSVLSAVLTHLSLDSLLSLAIYLLILSVAGLIGFVALARGPSHAH